MVGESASTPAAPGPDGEAWASAVPGDVAAYLRSAGRLSWPWRRAQVRSELAANLYQAMLDHRLTLGEAQAWAAALQDFGPPARLLPFKFTLYRSALAVLALGAATYAAARTLGWP